MRRKERYSYKSRSIAIDKISNIVYEKGGYWAIIVKNDEFIVSNYVSGNDRLLMEMWR